MLMVISCCCQCICFNGFVERGLLRGRMVLLGECLCCEECELWGVFVDWYVECELFVIGQMGLLNLVVVILVFGYDGVDGVGELWIGFGCVEKICGLKVVDGVQYVIVLVEGVCEECYLVVQYFFGFEVV